MEVLAIATSSTTASPVDEHKAVLTAAVEKLQTSIVTRVGEIEPGRVAEQQSKVEEEGMETKRNDSVRPKVSFGGVTVGVDGVWVNASQTTREAAAAHRWPAGLARSLA